MTNNKIPSNNKMAIYLDRILSPFFFVISFFVVFPVTAISSYKKILIFFFLLLMFIPVISFLNPQNINYFAYYTIIITLSAAFFLINVKEFKLDSLILFYSWYLLNGIFIRGLFNIQPPYSLFILPLTSISLYLIFVYMQSEYKSDVTIFFLKLLMVIVFLEALIGISQSFFSFPVFSNIENDSFANALFIRNRNYLAYIFPSFSPEVTQGCGTFSHPNILGSLLSLTFPIIFGYWYSNKKKLLRIMLVIITFLGLITTYSRGALLGILFTFSFFYLFFFKSTVKKKVVFLSLIIFFSVFFLSRDIESYYASTQNFTIRLDIWEVALHFALSDPLRLIFGYGIFFFRDNVLGFGGLPKDIHSGQLEIFIELGVLGIVLFIKFYFQILLKALRYNNILILSISAGLISFFIHQIVENSLFGYMGILMVCLFGLLQLLMTNNNEEILKWWFSNR